jgi:hypothetical protein
VGKVPLLTLNAVESIKAFVETSEARDDMAVVEASTTVAPTVLKLFFIIILIQG